VLLINHMAGLGTAMLVMAALALVGVLLSGRRWEPGQPRLTNRASMYIITSNLDRSDCQW